MLSHQGRLVEERSMFWVGKINGKFSPSKGGGKGREGTVSSESSLCEGMQVGIHKSAHQVAKLWKTSLKGYVGPGISKRGIHVG